MKSIDMFRFIALSLLVTFALACTPTSKNTDMKEKQMNASDILGKPEYPAISYGGYRDANHDIEPTIAQLKEDMLIMHAMGIRLLRTYKVHRPHAANVLAAIRELKEADPEFEMYVMLGAWIDCKNAWTDLPPDHEQESPRNETEIARSVELANQYPDIVKVIAVGNEAMVKWATSYFVQPWVILKWVNHLQDLKQQGELPADLWITSSDNFASWGGGEAQYHVKDLNELIRAVDFLSIHTYPMHDTHYNPIFWGVEEEEKELDKEAQIMAAMVRAKGYAQAQYDSVVAYMQSLGIDKPVHIGETGWASSANGHYGPKGSKATDEYKEGLYHQHLREWTNAAGISCFYFEAFDEPWKDARNPGGSENHFGLFTVDGQAKYAVWDLVDAGIFEGLGRNGQPIKKTFDGDKEKLMETVLIPPSRVAVAQ
jgi:exo-beta-1,3-glucanase (GH17 family)